MKKLLLLLLLLLPSPLLAQQTNNLIFIQHAAWSCTLALGAAATTECRPIATTGQRNYVTDVEIQATSANAGTVQLKYGTGTNCGTGTTALSGIYNLTSNVSTVPQILAIGRTIPLIPAISTAICVTSVGASATYTVTLSGFMAP